LVGVSYIYNKAYFEPSVWINESTPVNSPFFSAVRYLDRGVIPNYSAWEREMINRNLLRTSNIGGFRLMSCLVADAMSVGYDLLQDNPCAFLESDVYITS